MKKQLLMSIGLMILLFTLAACGGESADVVEETAVEPMAEIEEATAEPVEEPTEEPVEEAVENPTAEPVEESEKAPSATILIAESDALGSYLTDANGMTLYTFVPDSGDESACYDDCAIKWPPLLVEDGTPILDTAITGELGSVERTDGGAQVTYNGKPLYYWVNDSNPGDTTGHGIKNAENSGKV